MVAGHADKAFDVYGVTVKLNYDIQEWLKAGIGYKYEDKEASNNAYLSQEYKSNMFTIMVSALF
jgi:regulation of enolase protein 1 (concanavalin A-like superfamily)